MYLNAGSLDCYDSVDVACVSSSCKIDNMFMLVLQLLNHTREHLPPESVVDLLVCISAWNIMLYLLFFLH